MKKVLGVGRINVTKANNRNVSDGLENRKLTKKSYNNNIRHTNVIVWMSYHILWLLFHHFFFSFLQIEEMGLGKRGRTIRGGSRKSPPRSTSRIVKPTPGTSIAMPLLPLPPNFPKVKQEPLDDLMAVVKTEQEAAQPLPVISSTFSVPKPPTTLIPVSKIVKKPIEGLVTMVQQPVRKTHSPILQNSVVVPLTTSTLTSPSSSTTQLVAPTTTTLTTLPTLTTRPRVLSSVPTKVVITSDTFRSRPEYLPQSSHIPVAVQPQQPQQPTILIQRPPGLQQQPQNQPQQRVVLLQPSLPHQRRPDNIKVFQVKR